MPPLVEFLSKIPELILLGFIIMYYVKRRSVDGLVLLISGVGIQLCAIGLMIFKSSTLLEIDSEEFVQIQLSVVGIALACRIANFAGLVMLLRKITKKKQKQLIEIDLLTD